jgi:UDP-N-acetylmuramoylalanine--D-glutamate ligase
MQATANINVTLPNTGMRSVACCGGNPRGIMDLSDKHILVVGLGRTGLSTALFCSRRGGRVCVTDTHEEQDLKAPLQRLKPLGVEFDLGGHSPQNFKQADLIIVSPGVPHTLKPMEEARRRGIPVWGEIELASRFIKEPIVAVTGTNGKTTTTTLAGEMLSASGKRTFVGGNIGQPLIDYVDQGEGADVVVAEVSSFQLDTIDRFHPAVAVLLNISHDHLDRYASFEDYTTSKGRVFENQTPGDVAIFNGGDPMIRSLLPGVKATQYAFGYPDDDGISQDKAGAMIQNTELDIHIPGKPRFILDLSTMKVTGTHNRENAAAAALAALAAGGNPGGVRSSLESFRGLPHRMEFVTAVEGVDYYNDSKATNVHAVLKALEGFEAPVILILGGREKGGDFEALLQAVAQKAKQVLVLGESREMFATLLAEVVPLEKVDSMDQAVRHAARFAVRGDVVLLSPACASFDMYPDYARRGEVFKDAVAALGRKQG